MSELLTTGQMIDQLEVGQFAKSDQGRKVMKTKIGAIVEVIDVDNCGNRYEDVMLRPITIKSKWRILPQYVTFEEAMKAANEGKTVQVHPIHDEKEMPPIKFDNNLSVEERLHYYTWGEIVKFNWSIVE